MQSATDVVTDEVQRLQSVIATTQRLVVMAAFNVRMQDHALENMDWFLKQWDVLIQRVFWVMVATTLLSLVSLHEIGFLLRALVGFVLLGFAWVVQSRDASMYRRAAASIAVAVCVVVSAFAFVFDLFLLGTAHAFGLFAVVFGLFVVVEFILFVQLLKTGVVLQKWHWIVGLYLTDASKMRRIEMLPMLQQLADDLRVHERDLTYETHTTVEPIERRLFINS